MHATPQQDHASIAHLARAHSKAGNKAEIARLLTGMLGTDDPDALGYIAVMFEDGTSEVAANPYAENGLARLIHWGATGF